MTTKTGINRDTMERELCAKSFVHWLDHVIIMEPPPLNAIADSSGGKIKFVKWDHLMDMVHVLGTERLIVILKARQLGLSWLLAAWALWNALYKDGYTVLLLSQGQVEAKAFLGKCKTIHDNLPKHLQETVGIDSGTEYEFPRVDSKITALPSTETAGRGETVSLVVQDEADNHEHLDLNYTAVKPTIDAGGQLIQCSTVNKFKVRTLFKELYRQGLETLDHTGKLGNGYVRRFYGWKARPSRDQAWYDQKRREAPETALMSADLYMEAEYPGSDIEALRPTRAMAAFNVEALDAMRADQMAPIETNGPIHIYQKRIIGRRYVAGTDTSKGVGQDDSVTVVMDLETGYIVADIQDSLLPPVELAEWSIRLMALYGNPKWAIENNNMGSVTVQKASEFGYKNLYEEREGVPGWDTEKGTRYLLWTDAIEGISSRYFKVPSETGLDQFFDVIRNPDKAGRIEAVGGGKDDYPIAVALAYQMRKHARIGTITEIHRFDIE